MRFKEYLRLDEMLVKEQGRHYFVLPVNIGRIDNCQSINDELIRTLNISEVLNCIQFILKRYLKSKKGFKISDRPKNYYTLKKLGIDINDEKCREYVINNFLKFLKATDFIETKYDIDNHGTINDVVYIFKIKNFVTRCNISNLSYPLKKDLYLKFDFIYSCKIVNNTKTFSTPSVRTDNQNNGYILVQPQSMTLYEISFHDDR